MYNVFNNLMCLFLTWLLKLREEHSLGVFENRVLIRIFGPKGDKVTGNRGVEKTP